MLTVPDTEFSPPAIQFEKDAWLNNKVNKPFLIHLKTESFSCSWALIDSPANKKYNIKSFFIKFTPLIACEITTFDGIAYTKLYLMEGVVQTKSEELTKLKGIGSIVVYNDMKCCI